MKTAVYLCQVGVDDSYNVESIGNYAQNVPDVELVKQLGKNPKLDPQELAKEINTHQLQRIVIAGDSPGFFKPAFTRAMTLAGRDPNEVRLASFR